MGKNLLDACRQVGIIVQDTNPSVFFANGQNGVVRVSTSPSSFPRVPAYRETGTIERRRTIQPDAEANSSPPGRRFTRWGV